MEMQLFKIKSLQNCDNCFQKLFLITFKCQNIINDGLSKTQLTLVKKEIYYIIVTKSINKGVQINISNSIEIKNKKILANFYFVLQ